jgi:nitrogen fixation-related uncharacterized protein
VYIFISDEVASTLGFIGALLMGLSVATLFFKLKSEQYDDVLNSVPRASAFLTGSILFGLWLCLSPKLLAVAIILTALGVLALIISILVTESEKRRRAQELVIEEALEAHIKQRAKEHP